MASKNVSGAPAAWRAQGSSGTGSGMQGSQAEPGSSGGKQQRYAGGGKPPPPPRSSQHRHSKSEGSNMPTPPLPPPKGSHKTQHHPHAGQQASGSGTPFPNSVGGVVGAGGDLEAVNDTCSRNPLHCLICNNVFDDPRLLSCYHSFCAKCLDGRLGDTKLTCPLCGKVTQLKEGTGPTTDLLLRYLLHTTSDIHPSCANCDNKGRIAMFYCNTCGQVLCNGCREETHRAKMFSAHDIIPVSRYMKDTPKKCPVHGEHYIMFSTVQKSMLCINCYRDTAMDARLHCVDLETAYSQGCRKLDRAVMSLRDLQVAVRDGITMLKNVLEELRRNSDSEKSAVNAVCQTILDALTKTQENLLRDVDCQSEVKDKVIRGQLSQLRAVLPTIKLHLTMCATISNAASKYDFLDLAYPLIDRLTAITHMGYPIRPGQSSQIKSSYKSEIARTIEPWVLGAHASQSSTAMGDRGSGLPPSTSTPNVPSFTSQLPKDYTHPSINLTSVDPTFAEPTYSQYYPMSRSTHPPRPSAQTSSGLYAAPSGIPHHQPPPFSTTPSGRKTPTSKLKMTADGLEEQFTAHCRAFSTHFNELSQRLGRLKEQVQDLHRDVTLQKGASYTARAEAALREGLLLEDQLNRRQSEMERIKKLFDTSWNETMRQVRIEHEVFQTQMNDLMSLRAEVKQLSSILQQLQSFLKSVGAHQAGAPQQQGGGGGGPSGGGGPLGSLSRQQHQQSSQQQHFSQQTSQQSTSSQHHHQGIHDNKNYHHLSSAGAEGLSRAESGSQVTPSLSEMAFSSKGGPPITSHGHKGKKDSIVSLGQKSSDLVSRLGRFSISKVSSGGPSPFLPISTLHQGGGGSSSSSTPGGKMNLGSETEYIQVDTSYTGGHHGLPQPPPPPQHHGPPGRRGILNQLMDKVRSTKDDRKKSASSISGMTGVGLPVPPRHGQQLPTSTAEAMSIAAASSAVAASNRAAARAAMYDAQVQYGNVGNFPDKSAVTALRRVGSQRQRMPGAGDHPVYTRAKSFVKSKSDDERPPSKLSRESRARSLAAMDPESLLRTLTSSSKEASRILSLYQSLLSDRDNPAYYYTQKPGSSGQRTPGSSSMGRTGSGRSSYRRDDGSYVSEDDYQQILFGRQEPIPEQQSKRRQSEARKSFSGTQMLPMSEYIPPQPRQSSLGRRSSKAVGGGSNGLAPTNSKTQVKVFVHEEPQTQNQSMSKSLEEQYFGFLKGGSSSSSSDRPPLKKPISCESLISLSSGNTGTGNSRKSSIDFDRRSVVTIKSASALATRQHQQPWEAGTSATLPPSPASSGSLLKPRSAASTPLLSPELGADDDEFARSSSSSGHARRGPFDDNDEGLGLHKADSFEGHEEAVRSIVAAVQETRTLQRKMQSN